MSASTEVLVEQVSRTRIVTINRPEARNSLTRGVLAGMRDAIETAGSAGIRCVVITGAAGNFCAGADLKKNIQDNPSLFDNLETYISEYHAVIKAIVACKCPTIAMVDGAAVGFGADIALSCDLRVVSDNAYVQEKFVNIGLMPDGGGTFWLPRLVGTARAMKMILLGEKVTASELKELHIAAEMVPPNELRAATMKLAQAIEAGPPLAFEQIRRALYGSLGDIDAALKREFDGQLKLLRSSDAMEGVAAWMQKRAPEFTGS